MAYINYTLIYVKTTIVGKVQGDTFFKQVNGSRHFLHSPPAIAFDISSLDDAEAAGANNVEVTNVECSTTYIAPIRLIRAKGFKLNRGFGNQIALPLNKWNRDGAPTQIPLF